MSPLFAAVPALTPIACIAAAVAASLAADGFVVDAVFALVCGTTVWLPADDAAWAADATLPSSHPNGDNSTRHTVRAVDLKPGDVLRVEGTPDGTDPAALDYIEVEPALKAESVRQ